jgi:hypothetical protein
MRMVALLVLFGVLVTGGMVWKYQSAQKHLNEDGVHLMALDKFEPFLRPWLEQHQTEFDHDFVLDYAYPARFRKHVLQNNHSFDGFFADAFGGSATRLRKQDRLRAFLGGPLKLLVSTRLSDAKGNIPLLDAWSRLQNRVIGIAPSDTALGVDTRSWMKQEGVYEISGPEIKGFPSTAELMDALTRGDCDAVILRADLQNPQDSTVWSWYRLTGVPADNYALGLILLQDNPHGELLRSLWRRMQPDFEVFRVQKEAEMEALRKAANPTSGQ